MLAESDTVPCLAATFPSSRRVGKPSLIALNATNPTALNARFHSIEAYHVLTTALSKRGLKGKEEKRQKER